VLVPLLLLAALPARAADGQEALRALVRTGEKAPAFSLRDVDGNDVSFRPGDGKPALVVFWSVFCPMCRELMPGINGFAARHGATVRVVGVNLDGRRFTGAVRAYLAETALRFPVGLDDLRGDFFVASDPFGVEKTPTAVLVDGGGTVRGAWAAEKMREFLSDADSIVSPLQQGASPGQ
jgi:cytochrome oxidase Cu insertion factor (SCO1/SenC/PrrC family)